LTHQEILEKDVFVFCFVLVYISWFNLLKTFLITKVSHLVKPMVSEELK